jgi:hypothetical protein
MTVIPDFTSTEQRMVRTALAERYDEEVDVQYADAEIRLGAADGEPSNCPVLFWQSGGCNFAIIKCGDSRYRCQFFYKPHEPFGTGVEEYEDLTECALSLLVAQAEQGADEGGGLEKKRR